MRIALTSAERSDVLRLARDVLVLTPHFKFRLSGVTTTLANLTPLLNRISRGRIAVIGPGLPAWLPRLSGLPALNLLDLWRPPQDAPRRVWHARRNIEMLPGIIMRDALRMPIALLFTSASQRQHTSYTRFLIARMDKVVATSKSGRSYLRVPATIVRHGIDTEKFRPARDPAPLKATLGLDPDSSHVGCFGRIRERKGTGDFVASMISLLPSRLGWTAVVAGRAAREHKAFERALIAQVAEAGLSERIRFVGEHRDIQRWHAACDIHVAPQHWEGFGMTPLEAMASGTPVVATRVGAFAEMVTDTTGRLVEPRDPSALTSAIAELMDDEALRTQMGQRARDRAATVFPLAGEANALWRIYTELSGLEPQA